MSPWVLITLAGIGGLGVGWLAGSFWEWRWHQLHPVAETVVAGPSCVKCGSREIVTTYHATAGGLIPHACGYGAVVFSKHEHLHRHCGTCGFEWLDNVQS